MKIYPSILEKTHTQIESKLNMIPKGIKEVQIDICDGRFVPSKTYASAGCLESTSHIAQMVHAKKLLLELDLMIDLEYANRFERWIDALKNIKPARVIFHYGVTSDWGNLFFELSPKKKLISEIGLGVHLDSPLVKIYKLLDTYPFSFVQVMGIEKVGYSGQSFSSKTYARIRAIRKRYPDMSISVDGGVKLANAEKLKQAGATQICPNSGLFKTVNVTETYEHFKRI